MSSLALNRIDSRLIHGQITTGWIKFCKANAIIVMDNQIATDPFMAQIFKMAAPPGVKLLTTTTDQTAALWKKDGFSSIGTVLLLCRDVKHMYDSYNKGFNYTEMTVGNIGGATGRINVHGPITLNEADAKMLAELQEHGVNIIFHANIDETNESWPAIRAKYFPNV